MAGLRVNNIPGSVTDKQLKVYFSNPKHGGGPVKQLLYPMPCNSAVIIYEDVKDAQQVMQKRHKVGEEKLTLKTLPRQLYNMASVQVEKRVSEFISRNPDIVDELQFVAELAVDFSYEREAYVMSGSWYQLEWALQHLDSMLDVYEFDEQLESGEGNQGDTPAFKPHEIKRPNIPSLPVEEPVQAAAAAAQAFLQENFIDPMAASKPVKKNKNQVPLKSGEAVKTQRSEPTRKEQTGGWFDDVNIDEYLGSRAFQAQTQGQYGEDGARPPGRPRKNVQFDAGTDFSEKSRPRKPPGPRKTRGIDVTQADFGPMPTTHAFTTVTGLMVRVSKDDITKQTTDCIVNSTSQDLGNTYGISRAIVGAVGQKLQLECLNYIHNNGNLNVTGVMHTAAGGNLDPRVKFILHTAGPNWHERHSAEATHALVCTYINCLQYVDAKLQLKSIAMPLISAGNFGFPLDVCVQAFYDALLLITASTSQRRGLKEVRLVCFDQDTTMAVIMILQSLQDCDVAQTTQSAIDRYKSNISQNSIGAENMLMSFKIPEGKVEVVRPRKNVDRQEVNVNRPGKNAERQEKPADIPKDVESRYAGKLDDKSDTDSEKEEAEAKPKEPYVAYRNLSESESEDEVKIVGIRDKQEYPYGTAETAEAAPGYDEHTEDKARGAANEDSEDEEIGREDNVEQKFMKKSKNARPGLAHSWKPDEREAELVACSEVTEEFEDFSRGYRDENEKKSLVDQGVSDSSDDDDDDDDDDRRDFEVKREPSDEALPDLDAESTDDIVNQISSILQRVQPTADDGDSDIDVGVGAQASSPDTEEVKDYSMCDSVGGSMVRVEKADLDDDSD